MNRKVPQDWPLKPFRAKMHVAPINPRDQKFMLKEGIHPPFVRKVDVDIYKKPEWEKKQLKWEKKQFKKRKGSKKLYPIRKPQSKICTSGLLVVYVKNEAEKFHIERKFFKTTYSFRGVLERDVPIVIYMLTLMKLKITEIKYNGKKIG